MLFRSALSVCSCALICAACPPAENTDAGSVDVVSLQDAAVVDTQAGSDVEVADTLRLPDCSQPDTNTPPCENDDSYEPNNTYGDAASLNSLVPGTISGLVGCDHYDWYSFTVPANNGLTIDVLFSQAQVDLDLYVYTADDPYGGIRYSNGTSDNESINYPLFAAETPLLIRIESRSYEARPVAPYSLVVSFHPGGFCEDDEYEPNDTPQQATPMTSRYLWGTICGSNDDYVSFTTSTTGDAAKVHIERDDVPVQMNLTELGGTTPIGTVVHDEIAETSELVFPSVAGLTYILKIDRATAAANQGVDYRIEIFQAPASNDTCEHAIALSPQDSVSGSTMHAQNDVEFQYQSCVTYGAAGPDVAYTISVPPAQYLNATLNSSADLTLYLLEDCTTRCCWGGVDYVDENGTETLIYHNATTETQNLFVIVDSNVNAQEASNFVLSVDVSSTAAGASQPDRQSCLEDVE